MAVGKNIVVLCNGVQLHDALKAFQPNMQSEELDATVLGSDGAFRSWVAGFKNGEFSMEGIWDADTVNENKIHDVLMAAFDGQADSQLLASFGVVAVGGHALMLKDAAIVEYSVTPEVGQLIMASANLRVDNAIESGKWGFFGTDLGVGTNGPSLDNGAASTNGGYYQTHLYQESDSAATAVTVKLQDSPDNSTWADVDAGVQILTEFGVAGSVVAGTIDRYTRFVVTTATGKGYVAAALVRR